MPGRIVIDDPFYDDSTPELCTECAGMGEVLVYGERRSCEACDGTGIDR